MGRMAYPAPGVNWLRNRALLAKPLPRAECVALGYARAVLYHAMCKFNGYTLHSSLYKSCELAHMNFPKRFHLNIDYEFQRKV